MRNTLSFITKAAAYIVRNYLRLRTWIIRLIIRQWSRITRFIRDNWRRATGEVIDTIIIIAAQVVYYLLFFGFILYTIFNYQTLQGQPFELAKISALLGGFALTGGFSGITTHDILKFRLRRIGALYIVSTIFFVLFGLYQPLDKSDAAESLKNILKIVIPLAFYGGLIFFLMATLSFSLIIRRLFRER